jgi:hypothetical protein
MKNYVMKIKLLNILLVVVSSCNSQTKSILNAGKYDDGQLEIFVNEDTINGYININEEVSCKLFFWGKLDSEKNSIMIYNPVDNSVNIGFLYHNKNIITIKSNEMLMPCQRVIDLKRGWEFEYSENLNCQNCAFGFIKEEKAFLYNFPNKISSKKSYLIKNDIVYIYEKNGEWYKIKYINNDKVFFWINKKSLYNMDAVNKF